MITPVNTNYPRIVHSKNNVSNTHVKIYISQFYTEKTHSQRKISLNPTKENITEEIRPYHSHTLADNHSLP